MRQEMYRKFIGNIKILQLRAMYKGDDEKSKEYKEFTNKLEIIRNRRYLAMLTEENEEKRLYKEIIQILEDGLKDNDEKNVLEIYMEIKAKTESYKINEEPEKEVEKEERER